jgi:hypothetical protein
MRHRTNRPAFPRIGAGKHRPEQSVVRRLSLAFILRGAR